MALGDGQGPPLGVLYLVVFGPFGPSSLFYFCCFIVHSIGAVHCGHCSPSSICFRLCDSDMTIDVKTLL